jgi:valyl-tRNA synthetase
VQALDLALADLRFDEAANTIYQFVWSRFCDWYIELTKGQVDEETKAVAGWAFDQILVMLHPFMPFITEELWHAMGEREDDLIVSRWPQADARALDPEAAKEIDWIIDVVSEIRSNRNELGIPPGTRMECYVEGADAATQLMVKRLWPLVSKLARVEFFELPHNKLGQNNTLQVIAGGLTFALQLEGVIDIEAERSRLAKGKAAAEKERDSLSGRLSNPSFVERAKPEAVEKARADHAEKAAEAERLGAALARLG